VHWSYGCAYEDLYYLPRPLERVVGVHLTFLCFENSLDLARSLALTRELDLTVRADGVLTACAVDITS